MERKGIDYCNPRPRKAKLKRLAKLRPINPDYVRMHIDGEITYYWGWVDNKERRMLDDLRRVIKI